MSFSQLIQHVRAARAVGEFPAEIFIHVYSEDEIESRIAAERAAGRAGPNTVVSTIMRIMVDPGEREAGA
jgi:hypothetical protein